MELRDRGRTLIFSTHQMEAAEAMCESVAIVDRGRLVAGGRLRDLKRATGRQWIRLALDGPTAAPTWLADLAGVALVRERATGAELELLPGAQAPAVLTAILARGNTVSEFAVVEPSLEALFIELVGRPADDDALRPVPVGATGAAPSSAAADGPA